MEIRTTKEIENASYLNLEHWDKMKNKRWVAVDDLIEYLDSLEGWEDYRNIEEFKNRLSEAEK